MAVKKNRLSKNTAGKYYVDDQCIACDACVIEAPHFFEMDDEHAHAYVKKQPKTKTEIDECENALSSCPVDAIGNDSD